MSGPEPRAGAFLRAASERYRFSARRLVVVGHSNGANLAASVILLDPHYLAGAVFLRVMVHCYLIQWKQYFVFGPCLYAATSRLIDIDISELRRNPLIKATLTGWHPECKRFSRYDKYHRETQAFPDALIVLLIRLRVRSEPRGPRGESSSSARTSAFAKCC
jgi:alpha-beta hydrolase superfamily lysophospholipase